MKNRQMPFEARLHIGRRKKFFHVRQNICVVNHAHDTDEAIREQVRKCWELIVVRGRQLEKNAVHVVVPEGGLTPQQMLDVLLAKIERDGIESVAETMSAE